LVSGKARERAKMKLDKAIFAQYIKTYPPNTVVFKEGDPGNEMYVIIEGEVEIRKTTSADSAKTLIELKKGDIFGEMALIDQKSRSATAIATKPTKLLCITEEHFDSVLQKNPDFSRKLIKVLSERLRRANTIIKSIMSTNKQNQVLNGLYEFAREQGTATFKGYRINLSQFSDWAAQTLGIPEHEILAIAEALKKRKIIKDSALGEGEIILEIHKHI